MSTTRISDDYPVHYAPESFSDRVALGITKFLRFIADKFFAKRYGHRAVVLETVAAVPGMVGGLLQHLKALRLIRDDHGWVRQLLEEAENERMHLMTFIEIAKPSRFELAVIFMTQLVFYNLYFFIYLFSAKTAHRIVGYFEEEAYFSYSEYLHGIEDGTHENVAAPDIAIKYWNLAPDARLREVVIAVRQDEAGHRDVNHTFADELTT
jgi:ubiquinol oxidase